MQNTNFFLPELRLRYVVGTFPKIKIRKSVDAFELLQTLYDPYTLSYRESCIVVFLDSQNTTLGWLLLSTGATHATFVDPKILFSTALLCGASGFVLSHSHPHRWICNPAVNKIYFFYFH